MTSDEQQHIRKTTVITEDDLASHPGARGVGNGPRR